MKVTPDAPITPVLLGEIVPSRWQPRRTFNADTLLELATSIQDHDVLVPILVFHNEDGELELLAGERRVRARTAVALTKQAPTWIAVHGDDLTKAVSHVAQHGWMQLAPEFRRDLAQVSIPARILESADMASLHQVAIFENLQREDLSPIEKAQALKDLQDEYGYSQRQVADKVGKSQGWVQQHLALLETAPSVQARVNTRVFTVTHARALAPLPAAVQEQVAEHVETLMKKEGDTAATTRKVQNFAAQAKEFLDPDRWEPNGSEPLSPERRNLRALLAHLLRSTDEARLADVVVALKEAGDLGRKPESADEATLTGILAHFTIGLNRWSGTYSVWTRLAGDLFPCTSCLWQAIHDTMRIQVNKDMATGCLALDGKQGVQTCTSYVRQADPRWPALLPVHYRIADHLPDDQPGLRKLGENGRGPLFAAPDAFPILYQTSADKQREKKQREEKRKNTGYLHVMRQFQALQNDPATYLTLDHPQAHACRQCVQHRPGEGLDGVECHLAAHPRKSRTDAPEAPDYGLMIRRDGLAVPRCEEFVARNSEILGAEPGKVVLPREATLGWFRHLLKRDSTSYHRDVLPRLLPWLTHPGDGVEQRLKRVQDLWKELWDTTCDAQIARLLSVLASEADVASNYRSPFHLVNPTTGKVEEWVDVALHNVLGGHLYNYPSDWPKPWVKGTVGA